MQWNLMKLSFFAIKKCNEYSNVSMSKENLIIALDKLAKAENESQGSQYDVSENILDFLSALSNEQLWFEENKWDQEYNRIYKMFCDINKNPLYDQSERVGYINISDIFKEVTGYDIESFCRMYFIVFSIAKDNANVGEYLYSNLNNYLDKQYSTQNIINFVMYISKSIEYIKNANTYALLRAYPLIRVNEKNIIMTNIAAYIKSLPDIVYWIVRDRFKESGSQQFTNYFGYCFECYVEELLGTYISSYEKIPETGKTKKADWMIETQKYAIIVEQKASLFGITAKDTSNESEAIKSIQRYRLKVIKEAFEQLYETSILTEKEIIRIILSYEKIYDEGMMKQEALKEISIAETEKYSYWIVKIEDFENLIATLGNDEEKFNEIMEKKIALEKEPQLIGKSLKYINDSKYLGDYMNKIEKFNKHLEKLTCRD